MTFSRTTIKTPEQADAPRSRHELNALAPVGHVLDKHQWWIQWTNEPATRAQWLAEMEEQLLRRSVEQTVALPSARPAIRKYLTKFHKPIVLTGARKHKKTEELTSHVLFPVPSGLADSTFSEGEPRNPLDRLDDQEYEDSDEDSEEEDDDDEACEGEHGSEEELALDEDGSVVAFEAAMEQARMKLSTKDEDLQNEAIEENEAHTGEDWLKKNPFTHVGWYCNMQILQETLAPLTSSQWTQEVLEGPLNAASNPNISLVIGRTLSLISAVLHASRDGFASPLKALKAHLPHERRGDVLKIPPLHCTKIQELVETTTSDATAVLDLLVEELALGEDSSSKVTPGIAPQTWLSDATISSELKTKFVGEVTTLENQPVDRRGSQSPTNEQVINLVHPSQYPCVYGQTTRLPLSQAKKSYSSAAEQMRSIMFLPAKTKTSGPKGLKSQWIPSEVDVDLEEDGGSASFASYINNLHPESFASMYDSLGKIFGRFVPLFDRVLWTLEDEVRGETMDGISRDAVLFYQSKGHSNPCPLAMVPFGLFQPGEDAFSLRGGRCQVIVKLTELHLSPTTPHYVGGDWCTDGSDAEKIIATGVYFFSSDNIKHAGVSFRTLVHPSEDDVDSPHKKEETQDLGTISALEDRCLVYPNTLQHRMEPFELADTTKAGALKVSTFCLVDPTESIASTAVIAPQKEEWMDEPRAKRARRQDDAN